MTVSEYIGMIDELISAVPEVITIEVLRRSIWPTETETIGIYRYKLTLSNGDILELTERVIAEKGVISVVKYRRHWQRKDGTIIKRWDNAPHHCEIDTFPDHLHDGSEEHVVRHNKINGYDVLSVVFSS